MNDNNKVSNFFFHFILLMNSSNDFLGFVNVIA